MASKFNFKLPKFNFKKLDARSRMFVLFASVIGVLFVVYIAVRFLSGGESPVGVSRVANAPAGLKSVPGGKNIPEYEKALQQQNLQKAEQAQMTGASAIPTMTNTGQAGGVSGIGQCNIICPEETANVKYSLDSWVTQGTIAPDVASALQQTAERNVPIDEYTNNLDNLVKQNKIRPEQAREVLDRYQKQHADALLQQSASIMDPLIKSGELPLESANELLTAQKNNVAPEVYATQLNQLVAAEKITPVLAQKLLGQYTQQRAQEVAQQGIAQLKKMSAAGLLIPEVEKALEDLQAKNAPVNEYAAKLAQFVETGKLTPVVSNKLLQQYQTQKGNVGPGQAVSQLAAAAEEVAVSSVNDAVVVGVTELAQGGQLSPDVAEQLVVAIKSNLPAEDYAATVNQLVEKGQVKPEQAKKLIDDYQIASELKEAIKNNIPLETYQAGLNQLVQKNRLSPTQAKKLVADYQQLKGVRNVAENLQALQSNNAPVSAYVDALREGVKIGAVTPQQATQLLNAYKAAILPVALAPQKTNAGGTANSFDTLKKQIAQNQANTEAQGAPALGNNENFTDIPVEAVQSSQPEQQPDLQGIMAAMSGQAQQLIASWQPIPMKHMAGVPPKEKILTAAEKSGTDATGEAGESGQKTPKGPTLIKAGTIFFGVLDTAVNSDYPDTPVMMTIVEGKFKGAKLLGKLMIATNPVGQMDKVGLVFSIMNVDEWDSSKTVNAFAIDPDTARTVMASNVNYHYLTRYGAIMATSFVQGYANAINNAGQSTTGIFGTSEVHPELSAGNKIAVGIGQVGQTLGATIQNYASIPPTVVVDSGVGLGILFMSDVT